MAHHLADQAQRRLIAIIENTSDLIGLALPDGALIYVNRAGRRLLGLPENTLLAGRHIRDFYPPETGEFVVREALPAAVRTGLWSGETMLRTLDGRTLPVSQVIIAHDDGTGKISHFSTIIRDLSAQKQAEAALRESQARLEDVVHSVDGIIWEADAETFRFNFVSQQAERLLGYPVAQWLEEPEFWRHHLHPEDRDAAVAFCLDATRRLQTHRFEYRMLAADGRIVWLKDFVTVLIENGRPRKLRGILVDITARKRAEEALRQSEFRYQLLFENNPQPMWVYDPATLRFLAVSEAATRLYGYTREEFLDMTVTRLCLVGEPATEDEARGAAHPGHTTGERQHCRKDGSRLTVELHARPQDFDGRAAVLVLAHDVTEKKRLEEKFLRAQRLENLGLLAAGIAHDLNNVLSPVLIGATLLRLRATNPADLPILETLEKSATRGAGLVRQILSFARGAGGEAILIQPKHLLRDLVSLIEETFPKSIQLDADIPQDLWTVRGNPTQFHQVLLNLCVNARDAMPAGGTLRLRAANRVLAEPAAPGVPGARAGAHVVIEIADTGTGIAPEILERIWEPFFTTKTEGRGTGLGLSTARGIVYNHGGFIAVDTRGGRGTTFRVHLPAAEISNADGATPPPAHPLLRGNGELVLVVDDEAGVRNLIATLLTQHGYRVLTAANGTEAIALFTPRATEIPLVITDIQMPELDGAALAHALPRFNPATKILFITGASSARSSTTDSLPPAIRVLRKPFTPEELLTRVHEALHGAAPAPR